MRKPEQVFLTVPTENVKKLKQRLEKARNNNTDGAVTAIALLEEAFKKESKGYSRADDVIPVTTFSWPNCVWDESYRDIKLITKTLQHCSDYCVEALPHGDSAYVVLDGDKGLATMTDDYRPNLIQLDEIFHPSTKNEQNLADRIVGTFDRMRADTERIAHTVRDISHQVRKRTAKNNYGEHMETTLNLADLANDEKIDQVASSVANYLKANKESPMRSDQMFKHFVKFVDRVMPTRRKVLTR